MNRLKNGLNDYDEFEFTSCPHKTYRVTIQLKDTNNKPVVGEKITFGGLSANVFGTTDQNGKVEGWFSKGEYLFTAKKDDQTVSRKVIIRDNSKSIVLRLKASGSSLDVDDYFGFRQISLGSYHSAAVTEDGSLYTWGYNSDGRLGNGTTKNSSIPIKIMDNVKSVSLEYDYSAAITEDGSLYMWGDNNNGQLGNGTRDDSLVPIKIMDNVKSVSLGYIGYFPNLAVDAHYCAAITEDGSLYTWGGNSDGQLGNGTKDYYSLVPTKIMDNVKSVSLRSGRGVAITEDGSLYTWGDNFSGQLGNGTTQNSSIPIKIMDNIKSVSLESKHSAAITEDGSLYMWGDNFSGQLGNGTTKSSSIPIKIMDNVKSASLGYWRSAAITEDGSLYTWGYNYNGMLGNGTKDDSSIPIKIMDNVKSISYRNSEFGGSGGHAVAITEDDSLYTWGYNGSGQLGNGTKDNSSIPMKILDNVKSVSLGSNHNAVVTEDGSLYMWGRNIYGQLGNGTTEDSYVPIEIEIPISYSKAKSSVLSPESNNSMVTFTLQQAPTILSNKSSTISDSSIKYSDLEPNETYNFYAMKSKNAESLLASKNLLHIAQGVSDANGNLEIPYIVKDKNAVTFVKSVSKTDLSSARVSIPDILCNGEEQFAQPKVTFNDKTLKEGVDYDIEKRYSAIYPGEYELIITGIRNYRGEVSATYNIYCEHNFANNKCTICKSLKDSVGDANGDGVVGVADLVVLQEFLLAKRKDVSINADIDKDGVIDVFNMCLLRKIVSNALS